jgi:hypothetical protein
MSFSWCNWIRTYVSTIIQCHYCIETVLVSLTKDMDFFHFQQSIFSRQTPK